MTCKHLDNALCTEYTVSIDSRCASGLKFDRFVPDAQPRLLNQSHYSTGGKVNEMGTARFPQRTTSPTAKHLHALLRYCPGYSQVVNSPVPRARWVLSSVLLLRRSDLPIGCKDAARELRAVNLAPTLTHALTVDQLCKIICELGRYCAYRNVEEENFASEQARGRKR